MDELDYYIKNLNLKKKIKLKLIQNHKGYWSQTYILYVEDKKYFIKKFENQNQTPKLLMKNSKLLMKKEIKILNKISKIKNLSIKMPKIYFFDEEKNILILEYIEALNFFENLNFINLNHSNFKKKIFLLGRDLAKIHKSSNLIFGDLNGKNILFTKNQQIYLIDPSPRKGTLYEDLAQLIVNFYPFNFLKYFLISRKKKKIIIDKLIEGYEKENKKKIDKTKLKTEIIKFLENHKVPMKKSFSYKIKKTLINRYINYLIRRFKNEKL